MEDCASGNGEGVLVGVEGGASGRGEGVEVCASGRGEWRVVLVGGEREECASGKGDSGGDMEGVPSQAHCPGLPLVDQTPHRCRPFLMRLEEHRPEQRNKKRQHSF